MTITIKKLNYLLIWVFFLAFAGQFFRNLTGWVGYGIIVAVTVTITIYVYRNSLKQMFSFYPKLIYFWLGALLLSTFLSSYFLTSLLGLFITSITFITAGLIFVNNSWVNIVKSLFFALLSILLMSLTFELIVSLTDSSLLPVYIDTPLASGSGLFYWSTGSLLNGGPIQGIVGNRNLLGFVALLTLVSGVIVKNVSNKIKILAIFVSLAVIFLTQSATITVALLAVGFVTGLVFFIRAIKPKLPRLTYVFLTFIIGSLGSGLVLLYQPLIALLNREPDMTDRFYIWGKVWGLIQQKPITGFGWLGHWVPWEKPYEGLIVLGGVEHLHAHNAYLDMLLQTGIIGLIFFLATLTYVGFYAWQTAVNGKKFFSLTSLLLLICLLVQAVTESRLLLEGNLLLLFLIILYVRKSKTS